eukprot:223561_1
MSTTLRRLSDNHPMYKPNEMMNEPDNTMFSMGAFVMFNDKSINDQRKDSMFQTFSDAPIISALQPIQTKMKPYIQYANKKWTPSEYDIPNDTSDWLQPKINCSISKKDTTNTQINDSPVAIYGHHYVLSLSDNDKYNENTTAKHVTFTPEIKAINTNINKFKRKVKKRRKKSSHKRAKTEKFHNKNKYKKKKKNKRKKKRSRTMHNVKAETPILYYADDENDDSGFQFNKNWNEMLN